MLIILLGFSRKTLLYSCYSIFRYFHDYSISYQIAQLIMVCSLQRTLPVKHNKLKRHFHFHLHSRLN